MKDRPAPAAFSFLIVVCLAFVFPFTQAAETKPNVVIFFTDDQGTLDLNCYGAKDLMTPHMDALAATGIRFTQAYAHKYCCPARAALFTGRHPERGGVSGWTQGDRHGSDSENTNMATSEVTLAEALQSAGYRTALFGKWHLGAKVGHGPLDQGFETHFGHLSGFIDNYRHYFLHGRGYHDLYDGKEEIFRAGKYYPEMMIEKAVGYIDANKDAPFFMTVAFNLPHYPEQPIDKFKDAYADLEMPRKAYARVISSVDDHVGRVMQKLDETGLRENTIVIMMSDNGHSVEENKGIMVDNHTSGYPKGHYYSAHGGGGYTGKWSGHKGDYLEGGVRVPAILSYPAGVPQGETRDQIVTVMDWFPTVLDLCGIEENADSPKLDGRSMVPLIENGDAESAHEILHFGWANGWALRRGEWKLIVSHNKHTKKVNKVSLHCLTDAEPEVKDYAEAKPELVAELMALHEVVAKDLAE